MLERHKLIMKYIITNATGIRINILLRVLNVSVKTLQNDLKELNHKLNQWNLSIIEEDDVLRIPFKLKKEFIEVYEYLSNLNNFEDMMSSPDDRSLIILMKLIDTPEYISMENLSFDLFISKTSVFNSIKNINNLVIFPQNSKLIVDNHGVILKANEKEKREILINIFSTKVNMKLTNRFIKYYISKDIIQNVDDIANSLRQILFDNYIPFTSSDFFKAISSIMISIERNKNKNYIKKDESSINCILNNLKNKLELLGYIVNNNDLGYINNLIEKNINNEIHTKKVEKILLDFEQELENRFNFKIIESFVFGKIHKHILSVLFGDLENKFDLYTHFKESYERKYLSSMVYGNLLSEIIKKHTNINLDFNDRLYLSIHIQSILKKYIDDCKNIIICEEIYGINQHIFNTLSKHYGRRYRFIQIYNFWELDSIIKQKSVDLIISTQGVLKCFDNIPFLVINPIITQETYLEIHSALYSITEDIEIVESKFRILDSRVSFSYSNHSEKLLITGFYSSKKGDFYILRGRGNKTKIIISKINGHFNYFYVCDPNSSFAKINRHINYLGSIISR